MEHSAQAYKTITGSLGEARENKGFLSTAEFTFSIHGQAEGCSAFQATKPLKKKIHFPLSFFMS